ncbi:MAG: hypothetical protein WC711_02685 [Candidatus Staskawiczbacteria bacterium]|jgi:hypothetical protein
MKKLYAFGLILFISLFCIAPLTFAQIEPTTSYTSFPDLLAGIAGKLGAFITVLGGLMIIVAGFLYLISAGDPQRIKTAKSALTYAIIGIVVGLTAQAIVEIIETGVKGETIEKIIESIATQFGIVMVAAGAIMIIVSGILYLLSAGDPQKIKTAKTALIYSIIGIAVGLAANTIVAILKEITQ